MLQGTHCTYTAVNKAQTESNFYHYWAIQSHLQAMAITLKNKLLHWHTTWVKKAASFENFKVWIKEIIYGLQTNEIFLKLHS